MAKGKEIQECIVKGLARSTFDNASGETSCDQWDITKVHIENIH
jgi:hypothetical protein